MKNIVVILMNTFLYLNLIFAQGGESANHKTPTKDFGVKGSALLNAPFSVFSSRNTLIRYIDANVGYGFSSGVYASFPLSAKIDLQTELLFRKSYLNNIQLEDFYKNTTSLSLSYSDLSLPVLVKFGTQHKICFYVGATLHYYLDIIDVENAKSLAVQSRWNISASPGVEWKITNRFKLDLRYHYSFKNLLTNEFANNARLTGINFRPQFIDLSFLVSLNSFKKAKTQASVNQVAKASEEPTKAVSVSPTPSTKKTIPNNLNNSNRHLTQTPASPSNAFLDTDGDGVVDAKDKCPDSAGAIQNFGCPEQTLAPEIKKTIELAMKSIQFYPNSYILDANSYIGLNKVAKILITHPKYVLRIEGHSDGTGTPARNLLLSTNRAKSIRNYFLTKGIADSRLISEGYGFKYPIMNGTSEVANLLNRRVELILIAND